MDKLRRHTGLDFRHLSAASAALLLALAAPGCGPDAPPGGCVVGDDVYANGSPVPANDDCNTCACADGAVSCTAIACPPERRCGGDLPGPGCDADEYCAFQEGDLCGAADATAACAPRPEVCAEIFAPVCACDGNTYENECAAARAGFGVLSSGECEPEPTACGGRLGDTCGADQYCAYENGDCGFADGTSVCRERPDVCADIFAPVCGCDGVTYPNACEAAAAGTGWLREGPC